MHDSPVTCSVTNLQVLAENIIVPLSTIWTNSAGNPVLIFYVQTAENTFVSEQTLQLAIEVHCILRHFT